MRIIIIDHEPYSKRREEHFFINEFRNAGYELEFWSIGKIIPYAKHLVYNYRGEGYGVCYFQHKKEFISKLEELDNRDTFIFVEFLFNSDTLFIYEQLKRNALKWGRLDYYYNPVVNFYTSQCSPNKIDYGKKIRTILAKSGNSDYWRLQYLSRIRKKMYKSLITSHVSFVTGSNRENLDPSNQIISIDYFDVEKYRDESKKQALLDYPYIVFADVYLGKHPDLQIGNPKSYMDIEAYYRRLNKFFDLLEQNLNMPVVIAAHPKASYDKEFNGRLCIQNESANLIINSKLMIQHSSLSVTFALLGGCKIIQFYDNEFLSNPALSNFYQVMWAVTKQTDSVCINIENDFDIKELYSRDANIEYYNNVVQKYFLKATSVNKPNFNIIEESIGALLKV